MSDGVLVPVADNRAAVVAAATVDGIVSAVIWARALPQCNTMLFTPEGRTGQLFAIPALTDPNAKWRNLHCACLPLVDPDLESITKVLLRPGLGHVEWVDHHHLNPVHAARLRAAGVRLIHDPGGESSSALLLSHLGAKQETDLLLAHAVQSRPEELDEPWRSWFFVFLAVQLEPFAIRQAVHPLIDNRVQAFDPAWRDAGEGRWQEILDFAATPFHTIAAGGRRLVLMGLASTERIEYRLLVDEVLRRQNGDVALVFFDDLPRLILRTPGELATTAWLPRFDQMLTGCGGRLFLYDRHTAFLEPMSGAKREVIEQAAELIAKALADDKGTP